MALHYTKEISKNTKENFESQYIEIFSHKTIHNLFHGLCLYSWDPYAAFDTHIAIFIYDRPH